MNKKTIIKEINYLNLKLYKAIIAKYKKLGIDVTPMHGRIIMYIYNNPCDVCQKDIEKFISCNKSTISNILDTMEKKSLIKRVTSSSDSRIKIIKLTDKSLKIANKLSKNKENIDKILRTDISANEIDSFFTVLHKIEGNIERI